MWKSSDNSKGKNENIEIKEHSACLQYQRSSNSGRQSRSNVDDLIITANEGEYIEKDISMLFIDEDQERLNYEIVEGPGWLEITGASALLQGSPPMNAQGGYSTDKAMMGKT